MPRDLEHQRHQFYLFVSRAQRVGLFCLPPPALSAARFPLVLSPPQEPPFSECTCFLLSDFLSLSLSLSHSFYLSSFLSLTQQQGVSGFNWYPVKNGNQFDSSPTAISGDGEEIKKALIRLTYWSVYIYLYVYKYIYNSIFGCIRKKLEIIIIIKRNFGQKN